MLTDWKDGIIVRLYKGIGPESECSNYHPITLMSVPGKVFAHVILARIQPLLDRTRRRAHLSSQVSPGADQPSTPSSSVRRTIVLLCILMMENKHLYEQH